MPAEPLDDRFAQELRRSWFAFLGVVEPIRPELHRYCLKLTGDVWSAEDLAQDTLLRAFGSMGRGDLHGPGSPLRSAKAWLFRVASNLWIDAARRAGREPRAELDGGREGLGTDAGVHLAEAGARLMAVASPQERAVLVLKDAFGFELTEIAEMLGTSTGAVKSALHRARSRVAASRTSDETPAVSRALVDRFVAAFNAHDVPAVTALLLETVEIRVHGVGGSRGKLGVWVEKTLADPAERVERHEIAGEPIVVHLMDGGGAWRLTSVTRLEEHEGGVSRILDYCYCPDTLALVATALNLPFERLGYHQRSEFLLNMIATTTLPWRA
jgi:RNA polymerase sigma-70 factor (ECF subfamily)